MQKNTEKAAEQSAHPVTTKRPKITGSKNDIFGTEVGQTRKYVYSNPVNTIYVLCSSAL